MVYRSPLNRRQTRVPRPVHRLDPVADSGVSGGSGVDGGHTFMLCLAGSRTLRRGRTLTRPLLCTSPRGLPPCRRPCRQVTGNVEAGRRQAPGDGEAARRQAPGDGEAGRRQAPGDGEAGRRQATGRQPDDRRQATGRQPDDRRRGDKRAVRLAGLPVRQAVCLVGLPVR